VEVIAEIMSSSSSRQWKLFTRGYKHKTKREKFLKDREEEQMEEKKCLENGRMVWKWINRNYIDRGNLGWHFGSTHLTFLHIQCLCTYAPSLPLSASLSLSLSVSCTHSCIYIDCCCLFLQTRYLLSQIVLSNFFLQKAT
jgi:hypothetical protein